MPGKSPGPAGVTWPQVSYQKIRGKLHWVDKTVSFIHHILDSLPERDFRISGLFKNLGKWETLDSIIFPSGYPQESTQIPVKDGRDCSP